MKRPVACLLFTLAFAARCSGQDYYDRIVHLKGAPFSAEVQGSYTTPDASSAWKVEIARAGDGSVYEATFIPIGQDKGSIDRIKIEHAGNNCNISFSPFLSHLKEDDRGRLVGSSRGLTITLEAGQATSSPAPTIEEIRDQNLREQDGSCKYSQVSNLTAKTHRTSLGQRTVDGMTLFGLQLDHVTDSKTDRIDERWESELGFTYSYRSTYPEEGRVSAHSVTDLKLAEPSAELFTVQDKYFPPSRTLPNARTILVSGLLDNEELKHQIESIFISSGRFAIAADSNSADMVVHAEYESSAPPYRSIRLEFQKPNGANLFWVSLRQRGELFKWGPWAQSPVVKACFANLWKRVEGVQAPPALMNDDMF